MTIKPVSIEQAAELPNMLGRIVPAMLKAHGHYECVIGEERVQFVLVPAYEKRKALREATLKAGR